jgi:hypothetical protein
MTTPVPDLGALEIGQMHGTTGLGRQVFEVLLKRNCCHGFDRRSRRNTFSIYHKH